MNIKEKRTNLILTMLRTLIRGVMLYFVFILVVLFFYFLGFVIFEVVLDQPYLETGLKGINFFYVMACSMTVFLLIIKDNKRRNQLFKWFSGKTITNFLKWFLVILVLRVLVATLVDSQDIAVLYFTGFSLEKLISNLGVLFMILVLATLEELIFRKYFILRLSMKSNIWIASIVSTVIFIAGHSLIGETSVLSILTVIRLLLTSLITLSLLYLEGNLSGAIGYHVGHNFFVYQYASEMTHTRLIIQNNSFFRFLYLPDAVTNYTITFALHNIVSIFLLIWLIYRVKKKREQMR